MRNFPADDVLIRIETVPNDEMNERLVEETHAVYPHKKRFGQYFTLELHLNAKADLVYAYLADPMNMAAWSYAVREPRLVSEGIYRVDNLADGQQWLLRCTRSDGSQTLDFQWSDVSSGDLLFADAVRIIDAQAPLKKSGCVILWSCIQGVQDDDAFSLLSARRKIDMRNIKHLFQASDDI